jgi:hypothetical protein
LRLVEGGGCCFGLGLVPWQRDFPGFSGIFFSLFFVVFGCWIIPSSSFLFFRFIQHNTLSFTRTLFARSVTMAARVRVEASNRTTADTTSEEEVELQKRRFDDLIELLLAAGYFRARIASLTPFDRVIGGLTWCISNSHIDVDIDMFFQEDSNIGFQMYAASIDKHTNNRPNQHKPNQTNTNQP